MVINLKDNSEKDKYILELFRTSPKEAFRLLFDAYHMKLCIYAVQLTDSFEMAEDKSVVTVLTDSRFRCGSLRKIPLTASVATPRTIATKAPLRPLAALLVRIV